MDPLVAAAAANEALQWACLGWLLRWVYRHSTQCHRAPGEAIARLETRMTAAEEESERLAENAHTDRSTLSRAVLDVELMKRHR